MNTSRNARNKNEVVDTDGDGNPSTPNNFPLDRHHSNTNMANLASTLSGSNNFFDRIHGDDNNRVAGSGGSMPRMMDTIDYAGLMAGTAATNIAAPSHPSPKATLISMQDPTMIAPIIKPMTPLDPLFTPGKFDGK